MPWFRLTACLVLPLSAARGGGMLLQAPPPPRDPATLVGCYALRLGGWSGPFPSGQPSVHQPPPGFRLTARVLPAPFGRLGFRRLESAPPGTPGTHSAPWSWRLVRGDSLEVTWSTGLAGVRLMLKIRADSLRGWADAQESTGEPRQPRARVVVWRVVCKPGYPGAVARVSSVGYL